jgi:hypothetical protein
MATPCDSRGFSSIDVECRRPLSLKPHENGMVPIRPGADTSAIGLDRLGLQLPSKLAQQPGVLIADSEQHLSRDGAHRAPEIARGFLP